MAHAILIEKGGGIVNVGLFVAGDVPADIDRFRSAAMISKDRHQQHMATLREVPGAQGRSPAPMGRQSS